MHEDQNIKGSLIKQKCFVYIRRSQDREDRQYNSVEKQDRHTREVVKRFNLDPIHLPPEERSAKTVGRPIFNDMVDRIKNGEAKYIAVWVLSRLSRNPLDAAVIVDLIDRGLLLGVITPQRTFRNTSDDKMYLLFEFMIAKKNNDDLSDQVKDSFIEKRQHGEYPGPAPLGYLNAIVGPGKRNIVPDPPRAPLLLEVFNYAATGMCTLDEVWRYSVSIGLTSKAGNSLSKQTLADTLKRRLYTGVFKYGGKEWHAGSYEPLISTDLYDQVQIAMGWTKGRNRTSPMATAGNQYPYKGLLQCGTCGFNITAYMKPKQLANGEWAYYVYYTCTKKNKTTPCKEHQVTESTVVSEVLGILSDLEITQENATLCLNWLKKLYNDHIDKSKKYKDLRELEYKKASDAMALLDQKLEAGVISDERYQLRAQKHEAIMDRTGKLLSESVNDAKSWLELAEQVFSTAINLADVFNKANDNERRELMKFVGSNWFLSNKKVALTVREPLQFLQGTSSDTTWRAVAEEVWNFFAEY